MHLKVYIVSIMKIYAASLRGYLCNIHFFKFKKICFPMTICKISCLFMYLVVGGLISKGGQNKIEAVKTV